MCRRLYMPPAAIRGQSEKGAGSCRRSEISQASLNACVPREKATEDEGVLLHQIWTAESLDEHEWGQGLNGHPGVP